MLLLTAVVATKLFMFVQIDMHRDRERERERERVGGGGGGGQTCKATDRQKCGTQLSTITPKHRLCMSMFL